MTFFDVTQHIKNTLANKCCLLSLFDLEQVGHNDPHTWHKPNSIDEHSNAWYVHSMDHIKQCERRHKLPYANQSIEQRRETVIDTINHELVVMNLIAIYGPKEQVTGPQGVMAYAKHRCPARLDQLNLDNIMYLIHSQLDVDIDENSTFVVAAPHVVADLLGATGPARKNMAEGTMVIIARPDGHVLTLIGDIQMDSNHIICGVQDCMYLVKGVNTQFVDLEKDELKLDLSHTIRVDDGDKNLLIIDCDIKP